MNAYCNHPGSAVCVPSPHPTSSANAARNKLSLAHTHSRMQPSHVSEANVSMCKWQVASGKVHIPFLSIPPRPKKLVPSPTLSPTDPVPRGLLTLCPAPTDPVGQSWPRGTGSVGHGAQGQ